MAREEAEEESKRQARQKAGMNPKSFSQSPHRILPPLNATKGSHAESMAKRNGKKALLGKLLGKNYGADCTMRKDETLRKTLSTGALDASMMREEQNKINIKPLRVPDIYEEAALKKVRREEKLKVIEREVTAKIDGVLPMKKTQQRIFTDNVIMINPVLDASEKSLFCLNGMNSDANRLKRFMHHGDRIRHTKLTGIHRPEKYGEYTKDHYGIVVRTIQEDRKPDFREDYMTMTKAQ